MRDYSFVIYVGFLFIASALFWLGVSAGKKEENSRLFEQCLEINNTMQYAEAKKLCTEFVKR